MIQGRWQVAIQGLLPKIFKNAISIIYKEGSLKRLRCHFIKGKIIIFLKTRKRPRKLWIFRDASSHYLLYKQFYVLPKFTSRHYLKNGVESNLAMTKKEF